MSRDPLKYVWDAREAGDAAVGFIGNASKQDFLSNDLLQAGVERKLEVLGEALGKLRQFHPEVAEQIPGLAKAVGMRNVLAHEYGSVNSILVWDTITLHLPALLASLRELEES